MPQANRPAVSPVMALRQSVGTDQADLIIYGDIGESIWEETVTAQAVAAQLDALPAGIAQINVRINSFGGSVPDGLAIYNALKRTPARIVAHVEGVAMSIASFIAMAASEIRMPATSVLMIHAPWGYAQGNAKLMREMADTLDTFATTLAAAYAGRGTLTAQQVIDQLLDGADHYYTGEQAVAAGLADVLEDFADPAPAATAADDAEPAIDAHLDRLIAAAPDNVRRLAIAASARKPRIRAAATPEPLNHRAAPAATNPGASTMPNPNTQATQADPAADAAAITAAANTAQRDRIADIKARLDPYMQRDGIQALYIEALENPTITADAASTRAMAILGAAAEPLANGPRVELVADEADKFRAAGENAILARAGYIKADGQNPLRGMSMREIARASVTRSGRNASGMDVREIVATAFTTTSDFPALLTSTSRSALLRGYEEAPESFPDFTRAGTLTDFRPSNKAGLGFFSNLDQVPEGGEYKYGNFGVAGNAIVLATYGKMFAITRQAIINDDLGAFTEVPRKMGRAAKRTIGDLVFAVLTANPKLADGQNLFSTAHKNLITGAPITTATVDAMQVALGTQKVDGRAINVPLKYLLVPLALKGVANTVLNSQYAVGLGNNTTTPNSVANSFQIIADARLDADSPATWYGSADPDLYDTIEVDYLDGVQQPFLDQKDGWSVDGTEFKVRIDAGVAPLDYRGLAKNAGA